MQKTIWEAILCNTPDGGGGCSDSGWSNGNGMKWLPYGYFLRYSLYKFLIN